VEEDLNKAMTYLLLSAEQGHEDAIAAVQQLLG